tara:strand:- start:8381 stop:8785 length:405 start_codon:yes stop_codon:yes gene_type:complete
MTALLAKIGLGKIQFFVGLGMIAAIGILFAMWRGAESEADMHEAMNEATNARLAVSNASIETLQAEAEQRMAEARERDARARQAAEDAARVREQARQDREALEATIERLRRPVPRGPDAPCVADGDTISALEGL